MKSSDIRDLSANEVRLRIEETRRELFNLRVQQSSGQLERPSRLRDLRRDIARLETRLSALKVEGGAK